LENGPHDKQQNVGSIKYILHQYSHYTVA